MRLLLYLVPCMALFFSSTVIRPVEGASLAKLLKKVTPYALQCMMDTRGMDALVNLTKVTPLYRLDLPPKYIAYFEFVYKTPAVYYVVKAGKQTGGYKIARHGENPNPTAQARAAAKRQKKKCFKYYVMRALMDVMCADRQGIMIATDIPDDILVADVLRFESRNTTAKVTDLDSYIKYNSANQREEWADHDRDVANFTKASEPQMKEPLPDNSTEAFMAKAISPGIMQTVATGIPKLRKEVRVRFVKTDPDDPDEAGIKDHQKLCGVIHGCDPATANDKYAVLSKAHVDMHAFVVELLLIPETEQIYNKTAVVICVDVVNKKKQVIATYYFVVVYKSQPHGYPDDQGPTKRQLNLLWWPFGWWWCWWRYYRVPHESLCFPHYNQFWNGQGNCVVGCGPVAWGMVFGYYDRRTHLTSYTGSQRLYRNGLWGIFGSDGQVAPTWTDWRMKNYIRYMNLLLNTWCWMGGGWTWASQMDNVRPFYQARQYGSPGVSPQIYTGSWWWWIENNVRNGWPVIILRNAHFPVVTRFYTRYYWCFRCYWVWRWYWWWWGWRLRCYWVRYVWYRSMYLHMGWGGWGDRWVGAGNYWGIVARY